MKIKSLIFSWQILLVLTLINSVHAQIPNKINKEQIKTVYLSQNTLNELIVDNPCVDIARQENIHLLFDDLKLENTNYFLRIIHCQADWKPSPLNEIEYLADFNDIPIRYPETSMGTKISYKQFKISFATSNLEVCPPHTIL